MGIAEAVVTPALPVAAKMLCAAAHSVQTVIIRFTVTTCLTELDVVFDLLENSGRILAKLTGNGFE
jgi:hypothetical protein